MNLHIVLRPTSTSDWVSQEYTKKNCFKIINQNIRYRVEENVEFAQKSHRALKNLPEEVGNVNIKLY